jgi:hypothetical protein
VKVEDRLGKDEIHCAAGHLLAELYEAGDQFRHGKLTVQQYSFKIRAIRAAAKRCRLEYRASHRAENRANATLDQIKQNFAAFGIESRETAHAG